MDEDWCEIRDFPGYLISNFGRVANWRSGLILKPRPSGWGYLQVMLWKDGRSYTKSIHILVAEAFVPGWDVGLEPNHRDGDKINNYEENLEWETKRGNNIHALRTGLRRARATSIRVVETNEVFPTVKDCANYLGIFSSGISAVLNGRAPHYKGFTFEYI